MSNAPDDARGRRSALVSLRVAELLDEERRILAEEEIVLGAITGVLDQLRKSRFRIGHLHSPRYRAAIRPSMPMEEHLAICEVLSCCASTRPMAVRDPDHGHSIPLG